MTGRIPYPLLAVPVALAVATACSRAPVDAPVENEARRNLVIVVIDALRADKVGCYGSEVGLTPRIDELAERALVFRNAYSNATFTFPSTASLFTSTLPPVHRITHDEKRQEIMRRLSDHYVLLPEVFKDAEYTTALLTFPGWVSPTANYLQGVDVHSESERSDTDLLRLANEFVSAHADRPFFLYLHFIDMHDYWFPQHLFDGADPEALGLSEAFMSLRGMKIPEAYEALAKTLNQPGVLSDRDLEYLQSVYDRRLRDTDRVIGQLADHIESLGLTDDTVLVVTSDHGEQFGEHGRLVHGGDAFYNELIHIPMVISNPVLFPDRVVATTPMTSIDLGPTVLDLVGLPIPEVFQGESLLDRTDSERVVYATDGRTWKAISRVWSFILSEVLGREELYHIAGDPGETRNLADERPDMVQVGRRHIQQMRGLCAQHPYLAINVDEVVMDDDQMERLRSLGYVD